MKKIHSQMKAQEWSQNFTNCKSMGIFLDTQGQLTPQPEVQSGPNSNSSKLLWLSLLPARMKKIHSKIKALDWSQHFYHSKPMGIIPDVQVELTMQCLI